MITEIDFLILNNIQHIRNGFCDAVMPVITYLGSGGAIWIITGLILLIFKKSRKTGLALLLSLILGLILSTILLKGIVGRERPFNISGALLHETSLLIGAPSGRFSFPSGHSVSSFSAASVLFLYNKKIGIPAIILASLIAFSRLYLYVHFPSDVLAGAIIGIFLAVLSIIIVNNIGEKINERKLSDHSKQNH